MGKDAALYLPGPLGPSKGSGARSTCRGSLPEDHCLRDPESSRNCIHRAQAKLSCGAGQGCRGQNLPKAGDRGETARPPRPAPRRAEPGDAAPRAGSLAPGTSTSTQLDGPRPGAAARVPADPASRPRGADGSISAAPVPRPPDSSHPPQASDTRRSRVRARKLCASGAGVWAGVRVLQPPLQPLRSLWPPPPPPAPTASFHKSPGAQPVPAFQAGPAPAAAVPKHEASSPNPRLRRIARRGVESRAGRRARGAVAANFPPGPVGRPTLDPGADPLPRSTSASRRAPGKGGCLPGEERELLEWDSETGCSCLPSTH